jgi:hypothetical protein
LPYKEENAKKEPRAVDMAGKSSVGEKVKRDE